jgi:hypothetical protein
MLPLTPIGEVTYDKAWMENVIPYCQAELDDPTIGDAFKSGKVIGFSTLAQNKIMTDMHL